MKKCVVLTGGLEVSFSICFVCVKRRLPETHTKHMFERRKADSNQFWVLYTLMSITL